ncbi:hypothetical protein LIER_11654 [Lithospermum erythrorhizon]|uniref:Uncharacterized protein n=1 Tax=Lithospermum erythrorhizon TaxID=34254 RepID=A0AAV3PT61_LITER
MRGSGVSRLKQHIAGGFSNVEKYTKSPGEISILMRQLLDTQKKENEQVLVEKRALRETLMEHVRRRHGITVDFDDEDSSEDGIATKKGKGLHISEVDSLIYSFQKKISNMLKGTGAFDSPKYAIGK